MRIGNDPFPPRALLPVAIAPYLSAMALHPQIAAFAAQLDDLSRLLRRQDARIWADKVDLLHRMIADSNFNGVQRFLALYEGEGSFAGLTLADPAAQAELDACRSAARTLAQRLAKEEQAGD